MLNKIDRHSLTCSYRGPIYIDSFDALLPLIHAKVTWINRRFNIPCVENNFKICSVCVEIYVSDTSSIIATCWGLAPWLIFLNYCGLAFSGCSQDYLHYLFNDKSCRSSKIESCFEWSSSQACQGRSKLLAQREFRKLHTCILCDKISLDFCEHTAAQNCLLENYSWHHLVSNLRINLHLLWIVQVLFETTPMRCCYRYLTTSTKQSTNRMIWCRTLELMYQGHMRKSSDLDRFVFVMNLLTSREGQECKNIWSRLNT